MKHNEIVLRWKLQLVKFTLSVQIHNEIVLRSIGVLVLLANAIYHHVVVESLWNTEYIRCEAQRKIRIDKKWNTNSTLYYAKMFKVVWLRKWKKTFAIFTDVRNNSFFFQSLSLSFSLFNFECMSMPKAHIRLFKKKMWILDWLTYVWIRNVILMKIVFSTE